MIDIETLGTNPGCVILSAAAVRFDVETGEIGETFYQKANLKSSLDVNGFVIEADTLEWWMSQNKESLDAAFKYSSASINTLLCDLTAFIYGTRSLNQKENIFLWGHGAKFDLGILEAAYRKLNLSIPWKYKEEMCFRTVKRCFYEHILEIEFIGTKHHPTFDCLHQIKELVAINKHAKIKLQQL